MENKAEKVICAYAGDPEDEVCSKCDGIHMENEEGITIECVTCPGYDPKEIKEEEAEISEDEELPPKEEYCSEATTTIIKAESGVTIQTQARNGMSNWYKFSYGEERIVPAGCDLEKEKQALWADVHNTIEEQVKNEVK
jgi:Zn ribbon nucleic-acid-binding protein